MKRKLRLEVEGLRVESFGTDAGEGPRGTVRAQSYTEPGYPSCALTCGASPPGPTTLCLRGPDTLAACCY